MFALKIITLASVVAINAFTFCMCWTAKKQEPLP